MTAPDCEYAPVPGDFGYIYLLTCKHTHEYGVDVITSLHYSEPAAKRRAQEVAKEHDFEPDEGETFDYNVTAFLIDTNKMEKQKGANS